MAERIDTDALEQRVLGTILANPNALDRVGELAPEDFRYDEYRAVYAAALELFSSGKAPSPFSVAARLTMDEIAGVPVQDYLLRLGLSGAPLMTLADDAATLQDAARRRRLSAIAGDLAHQADTSGDTLEAIVERAEQSLYGLTERRSTEAIRTMREAADEALWCASAAYDRGSGLSGHSTGIVELDKLMGGLQDTDLVIIAGRPGQGKTALATNIACTLAEAELPVGFFSLEMSAEQLATRVIAERAKVPSSRIRRGAINEVDYCELVDAGRKIGALPVVIDETGGLTIAQVAVRARRMKRVHGVRAIVVDYIQLMQGMNKRRGDSRVNEVTEITTGLKALAKELEIPVVALSQLSREVEKRDDKRPRLSDLRESGSIEQDADVVLFVYREEHYLGASEPRDGTPEHVEWQAEMERAKGRAEIIIGKQRHGPTGTVDVAFDANVTAFRDLPAETVEAA